MNLFKPAPLEILVNFIKGFFTFWALVIAPTAIAFLVHVYLEMPVLGVISGYGLLGIAVAIVRSRKSKIEVTPDLRVVTVRAQKGHPELLTSTVIVNAVFALEAVGMWIIFIK